jgi:hypothetical protein
MNLKHYYSDQQGLLGILKDKEIWATNIQFLNDDSEYQYTMSLISRLLPDLVFYTVEDWKVKLNKQRPVERIIIGPNQYQDLA